MQQNETKMKSEHSEDDGSREILLYLIRHGEAHHNVEEKVAQKHAQSKAQMEGLSSESTKQRMEEARQEILEDPAFFDASLSDQGSADADCCRAKLLELLEKWPSPTRVLVSPLQRSLQTASLVFPQQNGENCPKIQVAEEVRERLTGRPADNRYSTELVSQRTSFRHLDFRRVRLLSIANGSELTQADFAALELQDTIPEDDAVETEDPWKRPQLRQSSSNVDEVVENEQDLAKRTYKLLPLLWEEDHDVVAIVSHKGYLRALERTQLGITKTTNFGNGEIRVYRANLKADGVTKAERVA